MQACVCKPTVLQSGMQNVMSGAAVINEARGAGLYTWNSFGPVAPLARPPAPKIPPGFEHLATRVPTSVMQSQSSVNRVMALNNQLDLRVYTNIIWSGPAPLAPAATIPLSDSIPNILAKQDGVFKYGTNTFTQRRAAVNQATSNSQGSLERSRSENLERRDFDFDGSDVEMFDHTPTNDQAGSSLSGASTLVGTPNSEDSDDNDYDFLDDHLPEPTEESSPAVMSAQTSVQSPGDETEPATYVPTAQDFEDHGVYKQAPAMRKTVLTVLFDKDDMPTLVANHGSSAPPSSSAA